VAPFLPAIGTHRVAFGHSAPKHLVTDALILVRKSLAIDVLD
jgi:hypothetical protein